MKNIVLERYRYLLENSVIVGEDGIIKQFQGAKLKRKNNIIIVYHGSPYKFDKFDIDEMEKYTSGQLGANYGFWFTPDKIVAERFASAYPNEMYIKYKEVEEKIKSNFELKDKKLATDLMIYMKENDMAWWVLRDLIDKNNTIGIKNIYDSLFSLGLGKREFPKDLYDRMSVEYEKIKNNDDEIKQAQEKIKSWYNKNYKGYVYTVEIMVDKIGYAKGENIGTQWRRINTIDSFRYDDNCDAVYIENADTGMSISDEIIVFDPNKIKIIKVDRL